jgi:hypothetical protein
MTKLALAFAVLAACSPPPKPLTVADPKPPPGPACEAVRDHLLSLLPALPKEAIPQLGEVFRAHCNDDGWSVEARQCLVDATTDTVKRCEDQLTPAQQQAMEKALAGTAVKYKKKTNYDFDDDTIEGDLTRPDGEYVERRKHEDSGSGTPARTNPPAQPAKTTKKPTHANSGDPCEGGQ